MAGKTMSDWVAQKNATPSVIALDSNKIEDMKRLQRSDLPQFDSLQLPYRDFRLNNPELTKFFDDHLKQGYTFCVRALPTEAGKRKGYTRKPKLYIPNIEKAQSFLESTILSEEKALWNVGISNMAIQPYGGTIISSPRRLLAEIGRELDKLTAGEEIPLTTYERRDRGPRGKWHRIEDKTASRWLARAVDTIGTRIGYFEFVITQIKNKK
jgi:hypothetical protein